MRRSEESGLYLASAHMTEARWWDLLPVLPICDDMWQIGVDVLPDTDDRGLPLH